MRFEKMNGNNRHRLKWQSKRNSIMARIMNNDKFITRANALKLADAEMRRLGRTK